VLTDAPAMGALPLGSDEALTMLLLVEGAQRVLHGTLWLTSRSEDFVPERARSVGAAAMRLARDPLSVRRLLQAPAGTTVAALLADVRFPNPRFPV
jgi:hypothetical protein